jgi:hypothetical protein
MCHVGKRMLFNKAKEKMKARKQMECLRVSGQLLGCSVMAGFVGLLFDGFV